MYSRGHAVTRKDDAEANAGLSHELVANGSGD